MTFPGHMIIRGTLPTDRLPSKAIKIVHRIHFFETYKVFDIDSTGTKIQTSQQKIEEDDVENLEEAYFEASVTNITVTDAVIRVVLRNNTDATDILSLTFTSDNWWERSANIADTIKNLANRLLSVEVRVSTASSTAGAQARFNGARLVLIRRLP